MSDFFKKIDPASLGDDYELVLEEFYTFRNNMENFVRNNNLESHCCPCCGYPTLEEKGGYEICVICNWEDEDQDGESADEIWGGANGSTSLTEARYNFNNSLRRYEAKNGKKKILDPKAVLLIVSTLKIEANNFFESFSTDEDFEKFVDENTVENTEESPYPFEVLTN